MRRVLTSGIMETKQVKRVCLTGSGGFFGSHLLRHLLMNTDWEMVCPVSFRHKGMPERIISAFGENEEYAKRTTVIHHDLTTPFSEMTKKRIGDVDYILNIASNSHVDRSITDPEAFVIGNTQLVFNMLELARELKPDLFLQFSTDEVYGPAPHGVDFPEWSTILPSNPYSASKAMQESMAYSYWRCFGVKLVITNCMNLLGQTQDFEKYPAQLIRKIYNGETVTIHGKEGDIGSRYYIHARNAADAVLFIIKNLPPTEYKEPPRKSRWESFTSYISDFFFGDGSDISVPDRYNIVGETELSNLELAEMTARLLGKELKYELVDFHKTRPGHDRRYALSGKKLRKLGWKPPEDFEKSWDNTIKWTLDHPSWL